MMTLKDTLLILEPKIDIGKRIYFALSSIEKHSIISQLQLNRKFSVKKMINVIENNKNDNIQL